MGVVATNRGVIDVADVGDGGERTPILFLHGVGSDRSVWRLQLDHFSRSRRAIAISYPGYGESDFVPHATRDDYASAVLAVMDTLGIRRAHICGLSLGGVVAITLHAAAPERCASLILADTFAVHPEGQAFFDRAQAASRSIGMRALAEARAGALLGKAAGPDIHREVIETMSAIDPAAYVLGARAVWLADQRARAAAIDVPTLILVGDEDIITPPALSTELAALVHDSRIQVIKASGHLANLEQPLAFNASIKAFLSEIE